MLVINDTYINASNLNFFLAGYLVNLFDLVNAMQKVSVKVFATESKKVLFSAILPDLYSDQHTRSFAVIGNGRDSLYHIDGDTVHSDCNRFCYVPEKFELLQARYAIILNRYIFMLSVYNFDLFNFKI